MLHRKQVISAYSVLLGCLGQYLTSPTQIAVGCVKRVISAYKAPQLRLKICVDKDTTALLELDLLTSILVLRALMAPLRA